VKAKAKIPIGTYITLAVALSVAGVAGAAFGQAQKTPTATKHQEGTLIADAAPAAAAGAAGGTAAAKTDAELLEEEVQELRSLIDQQSRQLDSQREALTQQQQRMQALEQQLKLASSPAAKISAGPADAPPAASVATLAPPAAIPAAAPAAPAQGATGITEADARRLFGPFTLGGDFRLRDEPFIGGPSNQSQDRNRLRVRLRLNVNARLNSDIAGGFTLTTGDFNQPITGNQTLNQQFTRKPFYLDKMFVTYTPHQIKQLSLTGGKFGYTWLRTELTWDNDLNPEGLSETLNFSFEKSPVFKRITFVGFQLPFGETQGVNNYVIDPNNQSIHQSVVYGGQIQTMWQLTKRVQFTAAEAFYNFRNADAAAMALQAAYAGSPGIGLLKLSPGSVQNAINVVKNSAGTIVNAQFASKFALADTIARLDFNTGSPKWPLSITGDYVQNTKACANTSNLVVKAGDTKTLASCNPRERRGLWIESRLGRLAQKNDFQLGYTRMLIEREAVVNFTNFDDMRASSNVGQHRLELFYNVHRNIRLQFTGLFGRLLAWDGAVPEPYLKRLQFDVLYTF
jgi:hypothetical protein